MDEILIVFDTAQVVRMQLKNGKFEYVSEQNANADTFGTTVKAIRVTRESITAYNAFGIPESFQLSKTCALQIMKQQKCYPLPHQEAMFNTYHHG